MTLRRCFCCGLAACLEVCCIFASHRAAKIATAFPSTWPSTYSTPLAGVIPPMLPLKKVMHLGDRPLVTTAAYYSHITPTKASKQLTHATPLSTFLLVIIMSSFSLFLSLSSDRYFSSFYLVVGTIFFYTAVGYFIHLIIDQNSKHYANFIACEVAADHSTNGNTNVGNNDKGNDDTTHRHPDPTDASVRGLGVSDTLERGGGSDVGVVGVVVGNYSHKRSRAGSGVGVSSFQSSHRTDHHHTTTTGPNNSSSSSFATSSSFYTVWSMVEHCLSSPLWQSWSGAQEMVLRFVHVHRCVKADVVLDRPSDALSCPS